MNDGIDIQCFMATLLSSGKWLAILERVGQGCWVKKMDWSL